MPEFFSRLFTPQTIKADAIAGVTVLFITLPQVIAYAFLQVHRLRQAIAESNATYLH